MNVEDLDQIAYNGVAGASSVYGPSFKAENAFNADRWGSNLLPDGSLDRHPYLYFKFNSKLKVIKFSFLGRIPSSHLGQTCEEFVFVASNDCKSWVKVKSVTKAGFTYSAEKRSWGIPCSSQGMYRCYGINCINRKDGSAGSQVVTDLRMYN